MRPKPVAPKVINLEAYYPGQKPFFSRLQSITVPELANFKRSLRLTAIKADNQAQQILLALSQEQISALVKATTSIENFLDHLWQNYSLRAAFSPVARIIIILGDQGNLATFDRLNPAYDPSRKK